ncbi:MAG: helix-turn-helix domain-containing protein [Kiritimatiellia bacterium]
MARATGFERERRRFLRAAGPNMGMFMQLLEFLPEAGITIKDAQGRFIYKNRRALELNNLGSLDQILGKRAEDVYPPEIAAHYTAREREVFESGVPVVDRVYGFVADRSTNLNRVSIFPIRDARGTSIGWVTLHYRARSREQAPNWYDPIRDVIEYINRHAAEDIPVARLAELSRRSVSQFRRLFARVTAQTPADYILNVRVNKARVLLETTDELITDIAQETGFCDHSHFIRTFKRFTGHTPGFYRRQHWGGR